MPLVSGRLARALSGIAATTAVAASLFLAPTATAAEPDGPHYQATTSSSATPRPTTDLTHRRPDRNPMRNPSMRLGSTLAGAAAVVAVAATLCVTPAATAGAEADGPH